MVVAAFFVTRATSLKAPDEPAIPIAIGVPAHFELPNRVTVEPGSAEPSIVGAGFDEGEAGTESERTGAAGFTSS